MHNPSKLGSSTYNLGSIKSGSKDVRRCHHQSGQHMQLFCQSVVSSYLLCLPSGLRPDYFGDCYSSGTTTTTTTTTPAAAVAGISLGALALRGASVAVVANNAPSAPRPGTTIVRSCRAQPPTSRHREQSSRRYGRQGCWSNRCLLRCLCRWFVGCLCGMGL